MRLALALTINALFLGLFFGSSFEKVDTLLLDRAGILNLYWGSIS
jgi:hypothetical protein